MPLLKKASVSEIRTLALSVAITYFMIALTAFNTVVYMFVLGMMLAFGLQEVHWRVNLKCFLYRFRKRFQQVIEGLWVKARSSPMFIASWFEVPLLEQLFPNSNQLFHYLLPRIWLNHIFDIFQSMCFIPYNFHFKEAESNINLKHGTQESSRPKFSLDFFFRFGSQGFDFAVNDKKKFWVITNLGKKNLSKKILIEKKLSNKNFE